MGSLAKTEGFPKIREARAALLEQALDIITLYITNAKDAMASGDHDSAARSLQWLLEHMPAHEGLTVVEPSVDKPKQVEGSKGPSIQINTILGGIDRKALPPAQAKMIIEEVDE